jgi:hypothetical protein
LQVIIFKRV